MSIRILTTSTLDSSPSILVISPNGSKTLVNCGEGCQRTFLESSQPGNSQLGGLKVKSIDRICLTHISHDAIGGLCGLLLTSADTASSSAEDDVECVGSMKLVGPKGINKFCKSMNYFMKRDKFVLDVQEDHPYHLKCAESIVDHSSGRKNRGKKRKKSELSNVAGANDDFFGIESIPMKRKIRMNQGEDVEIPILSYIFSTQKIPGRFQIEKARQLQIPPGPLYAQLKHAPITFTHPETKEDVTVHPSQVLEGGSDGIFFAIIYCPDDYVLSQFCSEEMGQMNMFKQHNASATTNTSIGTKELEVIVHISPKYLFESAKYKRWIEQFGPSTKHITVHPMEGLQLDSGNECIDGSPFHSAIAGAVTRSLVHGGIYLNPYPDTMNPESQSGKSCIENSSEQNSCDDPSIITARPNMEYILTPLKNKGINIHSIPSSDTDNAHYLSPSSALEIEDLLNKSGSLKIAKQIIGDSVGDAGNRITSCEGEILFTGTGSALPCKHRNVTGIYMQCNPREGSTMTANSIMLDVGEGTTGQLLRAWSRNNTKDQVEARMKGIKAIFISHPHADHHLGLVRLLSERQALLSSGVQSAHNVEDLRVVLMAPRTIISYLEEYSTIDPTIRGSYIAIDCAELLPEKRHPADNCMVSTQYKSTRQQTRTAMEHLFEYLGIECETVQVTHCAWAYGIVIDGTSFGRVVYSGDCRPSDHLAFIGKNADILIHEATFEDGKENEAIAKKHSTIGEAISIGRKMQAKSIILTHFSQRYHQGIPPCPQLDQVADGSNCERDLKIVFAFDFMNLTPNTMKLSSKLTPAMRLLYEANDPNDMEKESIKFESLKSINSS